MVSPTRKEPIWLKNKVLDCYPKSPPDGAKFYLTERFLFSCSSYWNWPFLSFISQPTRAFPIHYLMGTPIECLYLLYLLNRSMDSRSKLSWVIIIALFPIFGTALLYFSLADFGVRRLKKRLEDATVQASDHLSTDPEVADYLSPKWSPITEIILFSGA